jgi:regulator of cell morphogenesis and NO signaling
MLMDATKTVREFAIENPGATRVFEKLKIDYCCGGNQPLTDACGEKGLDPQQVLQLLQQAEEAGVESKPSSAESLPLVSLINVIVEKHHVFTRNELERLTALFEQVCTAHGQNHPELWDIRWQFQMLRAELEQHMMKEERILFPYITRLEAALAGNKPAPFAPFGTAQNPITVMMREHDAAGEILKAIRKLSKDFTTPEDGCLSYQTLYKALEELEADLHQHIHLENNILFPSSLELEQKTVTV